jgi:soluble lytic murein transglycosylase-like protein
MISVQKVIFPGIVAGCLVLVMITGLIANPNIALASGPVLEQNAGLAAQMDLASQGAEASMENADAVQENQAQTEENMSCPIYESYPASIQQWCSLINQYASENNLDPNLVAAVMLQESGGNQDAYSKSGAVGLMQVMPRDGLAAQFMCINGPCFAARPSTDELYDPEFNISYGTNMLAGLITKHGDIREALRAYGPMNIGYHYADIVLDIFNRYR